MIDFSSPVWWFAGLFVVLLFGLMVWFPVYYWRQDRRRRRTREGR